MRLLFLLGTVVTAAAIIPILPHLLHERTVNYKDSNGNQLEGYLAYPLWVTPNRKAPAVIVFHAFLGRTPFEEDRTRQLAKLGYVAFAADTYGKNGAANTTDGNFAIMNALLGNRTTVLRDRILKAWEYVNTLKFVDKTKIGSIGYCFGGLCTLDLARFNVGLKAAVSFHGTLDDYPGNGTEIDASVQAHHGDIDPFTTNSDQFLEEMRRRNGDWVFERYAHAQHAFAMTFIDSLNIPGASFNPIAANRSWTAMEAFLAEKLF
ncbi:unnamed protein product [Caenorhabditis auriculariae]|uniref:Dienelactone hydrolase domain-containing protein n=1 Tax=Caenorhabditis auriculariae TaxID=2777116 RepID=A0A8S1HHU4_9PELO|nr:unnamed protein product [Caenorhabditis auriculariae]